MGHYLLKNAPRTGTGDLLISVQAIEPLKIPMISELKEKEFNKLIDKLIKDDNNLEVISLIDDLIFKLYNLNFKEQELINSMD